MPTYNGHPSYNAWNVALWLGNDDGLYATVKDAIRRNRSRDAAAREILSTLNECGITKTPDGVPYTYTNIRRAIRDL